MGKKPEIITFVPEEAAIVNEQHGLDDKKDLIFGVPDIPMVTDDTDALNLIKFKNGVNRLKDIKFAVDQIYAVKSNDGTAFPIRVFRTDDNVYIIGAKINKKEDVNTVWENGKCTQDLAIRILDAIEKILTPYVSNASMVVEERAIVFHCNITEVI